MTSDADRDLPVERANNARYRAALERYLSTPVEVGMSRNEQWLERAPVSGKGRIGVAALAGRVALARPDEDLGSAFYIGARWLSESYYEHRVVSWDAAAAEVFYNPEKATHPLCSDVVVRRTLLSRHDEIVGLHDEWVTARSGGQPPFPVQELQIPAAPVAPTDTRRRRTAARPTVTQDQISSPAVTPETPTLSPPRQINSPSGVSAPRRASVDDGLRSGMRAPEVVETVLAAPRSQALTSLLSTLQPDQYRLVTGDPTVPLVIQGHPGTGKTIVATHRAAFLVSDERGDARARTLLFVGPSIYWMRHVEGAIRELDPSQRVRVVSSVDWMHRIVGQPERLEGDPDGTHHDADAQLFDLAQSAASLHRDEEGWATGKRARRENLRAVYSVVRTGRSRRGTRLGDWREFAQWARTLPTFEQALARRRHQPLMAAIALAVQGRPAVLFDHIVVDEGQDVSPLEWSVIQAHSRGGWTIVGDMNQRRNDLGYSSWEPLVSHLRLTAHGNPVSPTELSRGYRSTQAILDFARPLLPARSRTARSLQLGGTPPTVIRVSTARVLHEAVIAETARLCNVHAEGTIAVIVVRPQLEDIQSAFLKSGWRKGENQQWHDRRGHKASIFTPASARGIEFDAVLVVEPGAFRENVGRWGTLYTSLTRANRELSIVHHQPLPDPLRRYNRR